MKRIYLDHNATTPVHPEVLEEMLPYLRNVYGNPSSIHLFGQEARRAMDLGRERVARMIGAEPGEIVFTSGGTEADNQVILGMAGRSKSGRGHVIASAVEHSAVLSSCKELEKKGFKVTIVPVDETGRVDPEVVADAIREETLLITVMLANNEVGTLEPIREIAEIAGARGIPVHSDAVHAAGKVPLDVRELGVEFLSLSGHKIYGPKGIGALYIRRGAKVGSLLFGGHHEKRRRAGTENIPAIAGFGKACEIAEKEIAVLPPRLASLRNRLQENIRKNISNVLFNGHPVHRTANTLNMSFAFVEGESLLMNLDAKGVAVSTGSACTSGTLEPSHVLIAMGRSPELAQGSLRFSLGRSNTEEDVDTTLEALEEVVGRLREMSPLYEDYKAGKSPGDTEGP